MRLRCEDRYRSRGGRGMLVIDASPKSGSDSDRTVTATFRINLACSIRAG